MIVSNGLGLASGGQSNGVSASASVSPMNIKSWFPLGLTSLISLQPKGLSRVFSSTTTQKHQFFSAQLSLWANSRIHWKKHSFDIWTCVSKVVSLLFNMLSRFAIAFLPRSKHLFILWLQSQSIVILEPKKIISFTISTFPLLSAIKWWDLKKSIFISIPKKAMPKNAQTITKLHSAHTLAT